MSGGVDSSVAAKLLAGTVYTQNNLEHAQLLIMIIELRPFCRLYAKLGYSR
jgi:hypothetical protein